MLNNRTQSRYKCYELCCCIPIHQGLYLILAIDNLLTLLATFLGIFNIGSWFHWLVFISYFLQLLQANPLTYRERRWHSFIIRTVTRYASFKWMMHLLLLLVVAFVPDYQTTYYFKTQSKQQYASTQFHHLNLYIFFLAFIVQAYFAILLLISFKLSQS